VELTGLKGKVAVVTGAARARSIGREIALDLGRAGCRVVVTGRAGNRRPAGEEEIAWRGIDSVADEVRALGAEAMVFEGDLTDDEVVARLADEVAAQFGAADFLVNNASANRGDDRAAIVDLAPDVWRAVTRTNLDSTFLMSQTFARRMVDAGRAGAIVNVSSISGKFFPANAGAYAASKAGIQALTKVMAREVGPHGIRVNAICPGLVDTARMDDLRDQAGWDAMIGATPLRRAGVPADVASLASFLLSDQASWITGQAINVDGGFVMEA
jgi:3-oxoacyl-[acyl-carrier protein] reductase